MRSKCNVTIFQDQKLRLKLQFNALLNSKTCSHVNFFKKNYKTIPFEVVWIVQFLGLFNVGMDCSVSSTEASLLGTFIIHIAFLEL